MAHGWEWARVAEAERRLAVVTGGGSGIGRASALRMARAGRDVVVLDVRDERGAEVVETIEGLGQAAGFVHLDVTDEAAVFEAMDGIARKFGRMDILVTAAEYIGKDSAGVLDTPLSEWHEVLAINSTGTYLCIRAALPHMAKAGWGRIVTFTSQGRHGVPTLMPYGVSKAAVVAITAGVAREYTAQGILANAVGPSRTRTEMVLDRVSQEEIDHPGNTIGRLANPEEIAAVVNFLASEENTYMSGSIVPVTGGPPW